MENAVSTQSQKITLVPNFVRHKSDQLSSMALVIIAPCNSFTAIAETTRKLVSLTKPHPMAVVFFFNVDAN